MLSDKEYQEIKQRIVSLKGGIEGAVRDVRKFRGMAQQALARKEDSEERLLLYTNHLSDAVKEYEDAHPVEEMK